LIRFINKHNSTKKFKFSIQSLANQIQANNLLNNDNLYSGRYRDNNNLDQEESIKISLTFYNLLIVAQIDNYNLKQENCFDDIVIQTRKHEK